MAEDKKTGKQSSRASEKTDTSKGSAGNGAAAAAPATAAGATAAAAGATDGAATTPLNNEPQLRILRQYVKDLSFENPKATEVEGWGDKQPEIGINLEVSRKTVNETTWEVTLKLSAKANVDESAVFVAEVVYGGLMQMENVPQDSLDAVLSIEGPRQLFPFARRILADMVRDGGFPSLLLSPVDFTQLYRLGQQRAQATAQAEAAAAN